MYKKDLYELIGSYKHQLAICHYSYDHYESMKYYVVIRQCDVFENGRLCGFTDGYFLKFENHYDFLSIDEFNDHFTIVDNCEGNKRISSLLKWLRDERKIKITIIPDVLDDGYWFEYCFYTTYPFYTKNVEEKGFQNFESAAKKAIEMAKKAYFETHGKDGVAKFLENTFKRKS